MTAPRDLSRGIWGAIGMSIIIMLAGLNGIPRVFYEACMIDGGSYHFHLAKPRDGEKP